MSIIGKTVLVTGGTGSFGSYICDRLINSGVKKLRIISRDEKKQYDMKQRYKNHPSIQYFLGDIRDANRVGEVMEGVDIVYQAAALKQVGACEENPFEAVKTNVIGVNNIIQAALSNSVEKVICVSTDKAVKPVNVMGMTKGIQERLILNANHDPRNRNTKLCVVRYGNVMLSRGSVIPLFRSLISENKDLSITDEKMTRFLLTLDDAIDLVMYATENTVGGEVFVKKAPSVLIMDLAKILIKDAKSNVKFNVIGKYPGEKIHEILITEEELGRTQERDDYFIIHPWWKNTVFKDIIDEYSSGQLILSDEEKIKLLISRADEKATEIQIPG
jgi:UDP-N-acetylglucosamine 4,6-dehydratase/5-epimerase